MNESKIILQVEVTNLSKATEKASELCDKLKEAKTLAGDLASLLESLEVDVHG